MNTVKDDNQVDGETTALFNVSPAYTEVDDKAGKTPFIREIKRRLDQIAQDSADNRAIMFNTHSVLTLAQAKLSEEMAEVVRMLQTMNNLNSEMEALKKYIRELELKLADEENRLKRHAEIEKLQLSTISKLEVAIKNYNNNYKRIIFLIVAIIIIFTGHVIITW